MSTEANRRDADLTTCEQSLKPWQDKVSMYLYKPKLLAGNTGVYSLAYMVMLLPCKVIWVITVPSNLGM